MMENLFIIHLSNLDSVPLGICCSIFIHIRIDPICILHIYLAINTIAMLLFFLLFQFQTMAFNSTKSMIALFVFSLVLYRSHSASGDLPRLCSFDDLYKPEGYQVFVHVDTCNVGLLKLCKLNQIYQFGDSISDVGNLIREMAATPLIRASIGNLFTGFILNHLIPTRAASLPPLARLP